MPQGLSVDDVVQVDISLEPIAAPVRNFGALLILGPSGVIDINSRIRQYGTLDQVASDFGTSAPEFLAADLFFSQNPQPSILYIGAWAKTADNGALIGGTINATDQIALLATLQAITTGGMTISVDGTPHVLSGLDFHLITNLNGAATVITTALPSATVTWNAAQAWFEVDSHTSGPSSNVSFATDPGSGALLATQLRLTAATFARQVVGIAAEQPVDAVTAINPLSADVYGIMFARTAVGDITDTQYLAVAAYIEGAKPSHILGITVQDVTALDPAVTTDLGSKLKALNYSRTFTQYSSSSLYAVASMYGRAFTTDFNANNSMITLMFKQEPGVSAETLNETQAAALKAKNINTFVKYQNNTAIIQWATMANGIYFDERHGADWLQNKVQTDLYDFFYTSPTKIPQTDPGAHQLATVAEQSMDSSVNNGFVAPGIWNSSLEFGSLKQGMALSKGYYVFMPSLASQAQSERAQRKAPTMQIAAKLAGAFHQAHVAININR